MKHKTVGSPDTDQEAPETISKTRRKAEMDALQDLGVKLVALPKDKLAKLELPETLADAVKEAKRITSNGALRRVLLIGSGTS